MKRLALATLFALTFAVSSAHAAIFYVDIKAPLAGPAVQGDQTVATIWFEDVAPNHVKLTFTSSLNGPNEYITDIAFNVHSSFAPSGVFLIYEPGSHIGLYDGPLMMPSFQNVADPRGPGNGFDYNLTFALNNIGGERRFDKNDRFQWTFAFVGLDALDFMVANADGHYAYAHIQGVGTDNLNAAYAATEATIPSVPEPTSLLLLATGLIAGARTLRKRS
jgi:hypothetical protein